MKILHERVSMDSPRECCCTYNHFVRSKSDDEEYLIGMGTRAESSSNDRSQPTIEIDLGQMQGGEFDIPWTRSKQLSAMRKDIG